MKRFQLGITKIIFFSCLLALLAINPTAVSAQRYRWAPVQTIPDYHHDTDPPMLVADQNRTVHAFSTQILEADEDAEGEIAIVYNQWTQQGGWTKPLDVLLSPLYHEARIMDADLDGNGNVHVVFVGGNDVESKLYYAQAPAIAADQIRAWTGPIMAGDLSALPRSAAFATTPQGLSVILYNGKWDGSGVYAVYSSDQGQTWSEPRPIFLTYNESHMPFLIQIAVGKSGWVHATWNIVSKLGQGRGIWYTRARIEDLQWSEPIKLTEKEGGLGTQTPTITEYNGEVFAVFNLPPKIVMRRSADLGETWSNTVQLFASHVGVNGTLSLVTDGLNDLHLFFGQRITGSPDIHGMWHSVWRSGSWTPPEAIISGPQVNDELGDKAFDPYNARGIASQGNVLLATWRSDPGNRGNGVWYSYTALDAPEAPLVPLPTLAPTAEPTAVVTATSPAPTPTPTRPIVANTAPQRLFTLTSPTTSLMVGIFPALAVVLFVVARFYYSHRR